MIRSESRGRVLVLDDEKNIVIVLRTILEKRGFAVDGFTSSLDALQVVQNKDFDAVITDLFMPEMDGMEFLNRVHELKPKMPVIMITAFGTVDTAVDAIKAGAFDYVTKPFEQSEICAVVEKATSTNRLRRLELIHNEDNKSIKSVNVEVDPSEIEFSPIFSGESKMIQELRESSLHAIRNPVSTLVVGEPGTGRESLVDDIHRYSNRSRMAYIRMNCSAVPNTRHNSELFGETKKLGRLEQADNGVLFIDEIQDLNLEAQIRLYDFLCSGSAERVDGSKSYDANIRVIAGSSSSLESLVRSGKFREELFFKLSTLQLQIPALRERREDLPELIEYLHKGACKRLGGKNVVLSAEAITALSALEWKGNLPQLENVVERLVVQAPDNYSVLSSDISVDRRPGINTLDEDGGGANFREVVREKTREFEREIIKDALHNFEENVTKTARYLGISRKGLQNKIKELRIR